MQMCLETECGSLTASGSVKKGACCLQHNYSTEYSTQDDTTDHRALAINCYPKHRQNGADFFQRAGRGEAGHSNVASASELLKHRRS